MIKQGWRVLAHPLGCLLVSISELQDRQIRMIPADDLHAHRQAALIEPNGHTDHRTAS